MNLHVCDTTQQGKTVVKNMMVTANKATVDVIMPATKDKCVPCFHARINHTAQPCRSAASACVGSGCQPGEGDRPTDAPTHPNQSPRRSVHRYDVDVSFFDSATNTRGARTKPVTAQTRDHASKEKKVRPSPKKLTDKLPTQASTLCPSVRERRRVRGTPYPPLTPQLPPHCDRPRTACSTPSS